MASERWRPVTRFHFHIENGSGVTPDEEGRDLRDLAAARVEAIKGIRSLLGAEVHEGRLDLRGSIHITAHDGSHLLTVTFAEAVEISGDRGAETSADA